ncbi:MAG: nuclear transport factor 2 family protein [Candidatus Methylomirabilales bacterium]
MKNPVAIVAVALGMLIVVWLVYPKNEAYRIRQRLDQLADVVSSTQQQSDAARLVHIAGLRQFFTEDVSVKLNGNIPQVKDRNTLLRIAQGALQQEPSLTVAFTDISVSHADGTQQARVNTTVVVTGVHSPKAKSVDAQELEMDLVKAKGEWRIKAVWPVEVMKLD